MHYTHDCLDNLIMTIQMTDSNGAYTHSLLNVNNAYTYFTGILSPPPVTEALTLQNSFFFLLPGALQHPHTSRNNAFHIAVIISRLSSNI